MGPLVHIDVTDRAPSQGARAVNDALLAATGRREPFAAVIQMPTRGNEQTDQPSDQPAGRGRRRVIADVGERIRMLKQLRPRLKKTCRGLAFVVSAEDLAANAKTIQAGDKLWGCPTHATADLDAALSWARIRLGTTGHDGTSSEGDA